MAEFIVGIGSDFYDVEGRSKLRALRESFLNVPESVKTVTLPVVSGPVFPPELLKDIDAVVMLGGGRLTAESLAGNNRLVAVCRWGVGYDTVDLEACADAGIVVTNAPEGVRKAMAQSAIGFVLALGHRILDQDRAMRSGNDWSIKHEYIGCGLVGKTLGVIGLGNIGREIVRIASVLDCTILGHDPYAPPVEGNVERVELDDLMRRSDFIIIQCALTSETRGMIDARRLAMMKPTAYLVNTARGPIVDEAALIETLRDSRIAGAALDVFEQEPIAHDNPLLRLDNVILSPHSVGWTDYFAEATAASLSASLTSIVSGELPINTVNRRELVEAGVEPRYTRLRQP
jgi:D-3-phosphoglycerate dehydrogenase